MKSNWKKMSCSVVRCPGNVQLAAVDREFGARGIVYTVYGENFGTVWVSQFIPGMVREVNAASDRRLHVSSCYRILRGEMANPTVSGHSVNRWQREDVAGLNAHLRDFAECIFVCNNPEAWHLKSPELTWI